MIPLLIIFLFASEVFGSNATNDSIDLCSDTADYENYTKISTEKCGCERRVCVRKCCQHGFYHYHFENPRKGIHKSVCIKNGTGPFKVPIYKGSIKQYYLKDSFMIGMLNCGNPKWQYFKMNNSNDKETFYIQSDGTLYYPHSRYKFYDNSRYCVDEADGLTAFLCYTPEDSATVVGRLINSLGVLISIPFLLITFLVYVILPNRHLHRKALMFYVASLLLAYVFLVTVQLYPDGFASITCQLLGYAIIFFFMVSFFWMNVMCIDTWYAFSGKEGYSRKTSAEKKRFRYYCIYACGLPLLEIIIVFLLNTYADPNAYYYPGVGVRKCYLDDNLPQLLYFYGPVTVLIGINIVLFFFTAMKIQKIKKQTAVLQRTYSRKHTYLGDKNKFNLYLKLLLAMGINWSMEIVSWVVQMRVANISPYFWYITDFCNSAYGVFIFFIFVFNKKIWYSLKKRIVPVLYVIAPYWNRIYEAKQPETHNETSTASASSYFSVNTGKNI